VYGIGTVARLAQVSVRTLRHYDDIGLLVPARVDPQTGYRSYSPGQMHRLHRILVLRDLGLPLAEIGDLLDRDVSVEQLRGILRMRKLQVHARIEAQEQQLARVEARLTQLEEVSVSGYEVIVKRLEGIRVVTLGESLSDHGEIDSAAGRLYPRLHAALGRLRVRFGGVSYAFYGESGDVDRPIRLTVGLPVPDDVTISEGGIVTCDMPRVERAATTVVRGAPSQFHAAFKAIHDWIEHTGESPSPDEREVYLECDGPRDTWVTELQVLLEPQGDPSDGVVPSGIIGAAERI
jgi:DNA-binding transcriptional MerR regulator